MDPCRMYAHALRLYDRASSVPVWLLLAHTIPLAYCPTDRAHTTLHNAGYLGIAMLAITYTTPPAGTFASPDVGSWGEVEWSAVTLVARRCIALMVLFYGGWFVRASLSLLPSRHSQCTESRCQGVPDRSLGHIHNEACIWTAPMHAQRWVLSCTYPPVSMDWVVGGVCHTMTSLGSRHMWLYGNNGKPFLSTLAARKFNPTTKGYHVWRDVAASTSGTLISAVYEVLLLRFVPSSSASASASASDYYY
jgi:hypothetical protein